MAYVVARFYYWLNSQQHLSTVSSGLLAILVAAPLMGVVLYACLFRFIRGQSTLIKLVSTIGLSVALPPVADIVFGTQTITSAPGLASLHDRPFHVLGTVVTTDQVIIYGFLLFVVLAGTAVLRFTDVGLRVRAMVDSEAMTSLSGTNPGGARRARGHSRRTDQRLDDDRHDDVDGGRVRSGRGGQAPISSWRGGDLTGHGCGHRRHPEVPAAEQLVHRRDHPQHSVRIHPAVLAVLRRAGGVG
jgi:hypothetical protein